MPEPRRFVQIHCASNGHYVAVADDGTAWEFKRRDYSWIQLPALPHHAARRRKPPSLAEEALVACERSAFGIPGDRDTIRRALERLQEAEAAAARAAARLRQRDLLLRLIAETPVVENTNDH